MRFEWIAMRRSRVTRRLLIAAGVVALVAQCATEEPIVEEPYVPVPRVQIEELWSGDAAPTNWRGKRTTYLFGTELATADDLDGDGRADLLIGDILADTPPKIGVERQDVGRLWAVSSADFRVLWCAEFPLQGDAYGLSIRAIGDVDDDAVSDAVVGCGRYQGDGKGAVVVVSGATGDTLYSLEAPADLYRFGDLVGDVGDLDADGVTDFVATAAVSPDEQPGLVLAYSARAGHPLHRAQPAVNWDHVPSQLLRGRDLDGDGVHEYFADSWIRAGEESLRYVTSYSGADGSEIQRIQHTGLGVCVWLDPAQPDTTAVLLPAHHNFQLHTLPEGKLLGTWYTRMLGYPGIPIALQDSNGDGLPELIFGQRGGRLGYGSLLLWPSKAAKPVYFANSPTEDTAGFGHNVVVIGDHDLDGVPDLAVGVNHLYFGRAGRVFILSTRTGASIGELRRIGEEVVFRQTQPVVLGDDEPK